MADTSQGLQENAEQRENESQLNPEEFEALLEVFRTLKRWSDERDRRIGEKTDGSDRHQSGL